MKVIQMLAAAIQTHPWGCHGTSGPKGALRQPQDWPRKGILFKVCLLWFLGQSGGL